MQQSSGSTERPSSEEQSKSSSPETLAGQLEVLRSHARNVWQEVVKASGLEKVLDKYNLKISPKTKMETPTTPQQQSLFTKANLRKRAMQLGGAMALGITVFVAAHIVFAAPTDEERAMQEITNQISAVSLELSDGKVKEQALADDLAAQQAFNDEKRAELAELEQERIDLINAPLATPNTPEIEAEEVF